MKEKVSGYSEGLRRAGHYSRPQRRLALLAASAWVQGPGGSGDKNGWSVKRPSKPAHKRFVLSTQAHRVVYLPGFMFSPPTPSTKIYTVLTTNSHQTQCAWLLEKL